MPSFTISAATQTPLARSLPVTVTVEKPFEELKVVDVKDALAAKCPKKLSLRGDTRALADGASLEDAGVPAAGAELEVKDLGPQVRWKTVCHVEYVGPLLIHPLFYHFPELFFGRVVEHSALQKYVYAAVMFHFAKRELETMFLHRFSHGTMPLRSIFKKCVPSVFAVLVLMSTRVETLTRAPLSTPARRTTTSSPGRSSRGRSKTTARHTARARRGIRGTNRDDPAFLWSCLAVFLLAELSNLHTHVTLRNLRPAGTTKRAIPTGFGFALVSCPNYAFETVAWTAVAVMTGSYAAYLFLAVSTGQMAVWAAKKHRNYQREFGDRYPRGRRAMSPFIF